MSRSEAVLASSFLPLLTPSCLPPPATRAAGAVVSASVDGWAAETADAARVGRAPCSLPVVGGLLSALAAVHVLRRHLLQQVERHLGVHVFTRMDWIEGPTAAYDSGRLLRVVTRPRDEFQAVDDGRRRQRLPQCSLVFVEIPQTRGEEVSIVEIGHVSRVTAARRSGKWVRQ